MYNVYGIPTESNNVILAGNLIFRIATRRLRSDPPRCFLCDNAQPFTDWLHKDHKGSLTYPMG